MCVPKTPAYQKPKEFAKEAKPDNAALFEEARARAGASGTSRSTSLTALKGLTSKAQTTKTSSVLG